MLDISKSENDSGPQAFGDTARSASAEDPEVEWKDTPMSAFGKEG